MTTGIEWKRAFDIVLAALALLLLLPVMVLIGLIIMLDSPGPILYRGKRVGMRGKSFWLYKFRSMLDGADQKGPLVTAGNDPRITRAGRFLRRTKLDELPSLWNVLTGEMSWVGPRPENEQAASRYTDEQRQIWRVRPGITSLATIKYRHEESLLASVSDLDEAYHRIMQDKLRLELEYVRQQSFGLDLTILFRTVLVLFR